MRVQEIDFITLVQGTKQFQIPFYQRTYAWRQEQISRLCDDIAAVASRDNVGASGHFLGSLVLAPSPLQDGELQRFTVVDGQQRLTSLMIAMCALRDHVMSTNTDWARRMVEDYLTNRWQPGDGGLRLLPSQVDRDDFRSCVNGEGERLAEGSISATYRGFRAWLIQMEADGGIGRVRNLELAIRNGLRFVSITADHTDNVHQIFETINNTGLKLSQGDLIRNYFFMMLPNHADEVYQNIWLPMQKRVGPSGIGTLVWLDLILRGNETVVCDDLYRPLVERLRIVGTSEAQVKDELLELGRRSYLLQRIEAPALESDASLREQLERMREWENKVEFPVSYPPIMFLLDLRDRGQATTAETTAALRLIESFLVRRTIVDMTSSPERVFNKIPTALAGSTNIVDDLRQFLSNERLPWPTDHQVRQAILGKPFYHHGNWHQRCYILRRLEDDHAHPERVDWAIRVYTIEHIMPQAITPEWALALRPEATSYGVTTKELHQMLLHTLGNLTLTGNNKRLSNHPFVQKRQILRDSGLAMNRQIAELQSWGSAQIEARGAALASRAIQIWPGPADSAAPTVADEWTVLQRALALLPARSWVGLAPVASMIGKRPSEVATYLHTEAPRNWHRVLGAGGSILQSQRKNRPGSQRALLEAEGVRFTADGLADPTCQVRADNLARLLGYDVPKPNKTVLTRRSTQWGKRPKQRGR